MINHAPTKFHNLPESSYFALGKNDFVSYTKHANEWNEICTCSWREIALWKRTFLVPLTRLITLLIYKKKQAVLNPKIGCFFLQKHRFSFPKAIFNFVKNNSSTWQTALEKNNLVKPDELYKWAKRNLNMVVTRNRTFRAMILCRGGIYSVPLRKF